jgi:hypothetical protein
VYYPVAQPRDATQLQVGLLSDLPPEIPITPFKPVHYNYVDGLSPYAANLCPFYLGAAGGDLRPRRTILHNVGRPCKWFLERSGD